MKGIIGLCSIFVVLQNFVVSILESNIIIMTFKNIYLFEPFSQKLFFQYQKVIHWTLRMITKILVLSKKLFNRIAFLIFALRSKCRINKTTSCKSSANWAFISVSTPTVIARKNVNLCICVANLPLQFYVTKHN